MVDATPDREDQFRARFKPLRVAWGTHLALASAWLALMLLWLALKPSPLAAIACLIPCALVSIVIDRRLRKTMREFACPRCGNPFLDKRVLDGHVPPRGLASRCQSCGLLASGRPL